MILVRKFLLIITLLTALGFIITTGVYCYLSVNDIVNLPAEARKLLAENILFLSILFSVAVLVFILFLFLRSKAIVSELDKIGTLLRKGNFNPNESFKRLGPIGQNIQKIYRNLEELNEGKSKRISSLNAILSFFMSNTEMELFIIDITGKIENVSAAYVNKNEQTDVFYTGKNIEELINDMPVQEILSELEDKRSPVKKKINKDQFIFIPVFNMNYEMALVLCILGEKEISGAGYIPLKDKPKRIARMSRFLQAKFPLNKK